MLISFYFAQTKCENSALKSILLSCLLFPSRNMFFLLSKKNENMVFADIIIVNSPSFLPFKAWTFKFWTEKWYWYHWAARWTISGQCYSPPSPKHLAVFRLVYLCQTLKCIWMYFDPITCTTILLVGWKYTQYKLSICFSGDSNHEYRWESELQSVHLQFSLIFTRSSCQP